MGAGEGREVREEERRVGETKGREGDGVGGGSGEVRNVEGSPAGPRRPREASRRRLPLPGLAGVFAGVFAAARIHYSRLAGGLW